MTEPAELRRIVELCVPPRSLSDRILELIGESGVNDVVATARAAVRELTLGELIDTLSTFYAFADGGATPPPELVFDREAGIAASSAEDRDTMTALSADYERHFGFPPVVFVDGHGALELATILEAAIASPPAAEFARIRGAVSDIYADRLARLLAPEHLIPDHPGGTR